MLAYLEADDVIVVACERLGARTIAILVRLPESEPESSSLLDSCFH